MGWTALLDACVLYPLSTRDLLLRGAERCLYHVTWSAELIDEVRLCLVEDQRCPTVATMDRSKVLICRRVTTYSI